MDNAIKILQAVNKISYLTGYQPIKVSEILIRNMQRGANFNDAAKLVLQQRHEERKQKLRDEIKEITKVPSATKPWKEFTKALADSVANGDIDNFLSWPVITQTMFVTKGDYLETERKYLSEKGIAITDSKVGNPPTDGNIIHQAYHIARFMAETGQDIKNFDYIFEFGGGYGCMCRLIHELGFSGEYVIYDLLHFSALQRYYLDSCQVDATCISDIQNIQRLVGGKSLFLSTWALSETPLEVRESFEGILPFFDSFLFAYQDSFDGIDNTKYFKKIKRKRRKWFDIKIEHLDGNRYLFGSK